MQNRAHEQLRESWSIGLHEIHGHANKEQLNPDHEARLQSATLTILLIAMANISGLPTWGS